MNLDVIPTGLATGESKKQWLTHELLRYRDSVSNIVRNKTLLTVVICGLGLRFIEPWWFGIIVILIACAAIDFIFMYIQANKYSGYYKALTSACFEVEADVDHDMRIFLNRVGNLIELKDENLKDKVYKEMVECYDRVKLKTDLREAINDMAVKEEVQSVS